MKEKVMELLQKEFPDIDFETSEELVSDGVVDSFTLTSIISMLSMEFDIEIPFEEIIEDNFNSADAMAEMVARLVD